MLLLGRELYRDLPWRRTRDPYAILVSEVMLQQTQVSRVEGRWERWLERFPGVEVLADAETAEVLREWQGLGYNRRALALQRAARELKALGRFPEDERALRSLPGIGPATAAGVRAFAFDLPGVYLETNVRAVFLDAFFPDAEGVPDRQLAPYVEATCPKDASDPEDDPRTWYYALLDVGARLKRTGPNPGRRSAQRSRQGRFEGSRRQKRATLLRLLLDARAAGLPGLAADELEASLAEFERASGRTAPSRALVDSILEDLAAEGFCRSVGGLWSA